MANIFRTASLWLKVAAICMMLGFLLFVIGFATPSWKVSDYHRQREESDQGLWQFIDCSRGCRKGTYGTVNDFHRAVQAMECLGLIGFFLAVVTLLLYLCADSARRRDFLQADTIFTFGGLLFSCIGFALASSSSKDNLYLGFTGIGYSMGLAIAGAILYGVAGIMLILQLIGC